MPLKPDKPKSPARRDKRLEVRIDAELLDSITRQTQEYGGASALVRLLLRKFDKGDINIAPEEWVDELLPARRPSRKQPELPDRDILTTAEVAAYLRLSAPQVYLLVKDGDIPSVKVGKELRVRRSELLKWLAGQ